MSRLNNRTSISDDQRTILNNYFIMYNNTLLEISNLHKSLNEIRNTINTFYFQTNFIGCFRISLRFLRLSQ